MNNNSIRDDVNNQKIRVNGVKSLVFVCALYNGLMLVSTTSTASVKMAAYVVSSLLFLLLSLWLKKAIRKNGSILKTLMYLVCAIDLVYSAFILVSFIDYSMPNSNFIGTLIVLVVLLIIFIRKANSVTRFIRLSVIPLCLFSVLLIVFNMENFRINLSDVTAVVCDSSELLSYLWALPLVFASCLLDNQEEDATVKSEMYTLLLNLPTLLFGILAFFTLGLAGSKYPIYMTASIAQISVFRRLESLFVCVWVATGCVKCITFTLIFTKLLRTFGLKKKGKTQCE